MWDPKSGEPWRPSKKQEKFIEIPNNVFEGFYGGAAGGGKSELLIMLPLLKGFHQYPQFHGIIFRRTYPQLEESIIQRAKPIYLATGAKYNDQKHTFTFESGATIRCSYLETDDDARSHDTAQYNLANFDELTHFSEFQYKYVTSRVRTSSNLPAFLRSASNPGNIGHLWVRDRFVMPAPEGSKLIFDKLLQSYRIFIPAKATDNPYLMKDDPGYITRLEILPEADRKAKLLGDWFMFAGQVFSEFRESHISNEPEHAIHVIEPFEIPSWWTKILAIDWGYTAQTYAVWLAIATDSKVYAYREYSNKKVSVNEWASDLRRLSQDDKLFSIVIDPSAQQNRGQGSTIRQQFLEASGFDFCKLADNDRVSGKMLLHEYLRWRPRPERFLVKEQFNQDIADRIFRMYGQGELNKYLNSFKPDMPETNLPKLQIFRNCRELIKTIPLCVYSEKKPEDVADFDGDDPYDAIRYGLKACKSYFDSSTEEVKKQDELAGILEALNKTGDQTSYYRRMENFERKNAKTIAPVFH